MQVIANLSVWLSMSLCISSKQILNKKRAYVLKCDTFRKLTYLYTLHEFANFL